MHINLCTLRARIRRMTLYMKCGRVATTKNKSWKKDSEGKKVVVSFELWYSRDKICQQVEFRAK